MPGVKTQYFPKSLSPFKPFHSFLLFRLFYLSSFYFSSHFLLLFLTSHYLFVHPIFLSNVSLFLLLSLFPLLFLFQFLSQSFLNSYPFSFFSLLLLSLFCYVTFYLFTYIFFTFCPVSVSLSFPLLFLFRVAFLLFLLHHCSLNTPLFSFPITFPFRLLCIFFLLFFTCFYFASISSLFRLTLLLLLFLYPFFAKLQSSVFFFLHLSPLVRVSFSFSHTPLHSIIVYSPSSSFSLPSSSSSQAHHPP